MRGLSRRYLLAAGGLAVAGMARSRAGHGRVKSSATQELGLTAARELLRATPAVDLHSHPDRWFLEDFESEDPALAQLIGGVGDGAPAAMKEGGLGGAVVNLVADAKVLGLRDGAIYPRRSFEEGEAWTDYRRQVAAFERRLEDGQFAPALTASDVRAAHREAKTAVILGCEGADFLEGRLERMELSFREGLRVLGLVHYRANELGDVQTGSQSRGLTTFGREVVREMNRLGAVIDLAHASEAVCRQVVEVSDDPVVLSHSRLQLESSPHPRLIDADHARLIAGSGGVIGAWPSGIGILDLAGFVDEILRLIDAVGIEHVGLGTDMDANYLPVFDDYRDLPQLVASLLARGLEPTEVSQLVGGNFLRVLEAVTG